MSTTTLAKRPAGGSPAVTGVVLKAALLCLIAALLFQVMHAGNRPGSAGASAAKPSAAGAAVQQKPAALSNAPHSTYKRPHMTPGLRSYYASIWGVDNLRVHLTNSNNLVRFTAHVVNAERAKLLADESATPALVARRAGVALQVPHMENVGKLRQISGIENGKEVWMVFSNKGFPVRAGDRVDVVVGDFRVENLVVD